jgi:hypothetical protein
MHDNPVVVRILNPGSRQKRSLLIVNEYFGGKRSEPTGGTFIFNLFIV